MSSEPTSTGELLVVAAPSGAGKTSLVNALLESDPQLALSISHTTRPPRPGEEDGRHYFFVPESRFLELVAEDAFAEHAQVFGNRYGTLAQTVRDLRVQGRDVILEIDWQGAQQVRARFPECHSVFILPPSLDALRQRLSRRAQDSEEVIERRMRQARAEISHWAEFDYLVVNDRFDDALSDLRCIIRSLRLALDRQRSEQRDLLAELL